jgi:hypothetical protein
MISIVALALALSVAQASPSCPARLDTEQRATAPSGWQVLPPVLTWSRLAGTSFSAGHPDRYDNVIPEVKRFKDRTETTFTIGKTKETVWMVCMYDGTRISIAKPIGSPKSCVVTTKLVDQSISIKCMP